VIARYGSFNWAGLLLAIIAVGIVFSLTSPYFATTPNFANLSRAVGYTGIVAAITTLVLVSGALDLSIAAMMSLAGVTTAALLRGGQPWEIGIAGGLGIGLLGGALNGLIVTRTGINPLIATIATQFLMRGVAFLISAGFPISMHDPIISALGAGNIAGVPVPAILMILAFIVVGFLLNYTRFGIHAFAIGGSPGGSMARLAGVPVLRRKLQIYMLSGLFAAIGGIVLLGYISTGDPNAAFGQELPIIAAVIMGGTALGGGRGSVFGTLLGVVLLGEIYNGLTLNNVTSDWQYVVQGVALLIAVFIDEYRSRKSRTEQGR
jgi:ribose/xylose/arabinose/galactoside ABC-type transport system permease subunit